MATHVSRRAFLSIAPASIALVHAGPLEARADNPAGFPAHEPDLVKEIVTVAHGNLARVKELVTPRPALARASWDWGFGDWESPIDAASHVGNRPIAEFLLANGARPTLFTFAMLGNLTAVKAHLDVMPGAQRMRGPHGLTLLHHARVGGAPAAAVAKYLESLGDADPRYPNEPLSDEVRDALIGEYAYGSEATERLRVGKTARGDLSIQRVGLTERNLFHHGGLVFNPSGAEAVRIRFERTSGRASSLVVEDGSTRLTARAL